MDGLTLEKRDGRSGDEATAESDEDDEGKTLDDIIDAYAEH